MLDTKRNYKQEFKYRFANEMRRLRAEKNFSVDEVAEGLKISRNYILDLELGNYKDWGDDI